MLINDGTLLTDALQREIIRVVLSHSALTGPDQSLPESVKVRHGRTGSDLLTNAAVSQGRSLRLKPLGLAIVVEQ